MHESTGSVNFELVVVEEERCNTLAGVKARRWRLGSQSRVGRVTCDWQRCGGWAPYSAVLLSTSTTRGNDTRWSSKLVRSNVTEARRSAQRQRQVSDEASSTTYPSPQRSMGEFSGSKGIAL